MTRAVHTSRRRFWRRPGSTRAASRSIMGALVAPLGRQVRHGSAMCTATAGAPGSCGVPRRRRGRGSWYGRSMALVAALGRDCGSRPGSRATARGSHLASPAAYQQPNAMRAFNSLRTAVPDAAGSPQSDMGSGAPRTL